MKTFDELVDGVIKNKSYYANVESDRGEETHMGVPQNLHPNWKVWEYIEASTKKPAVEYLGIKRLIFLN